MLRQRLNFSLPHWRISQPTRPQYLDRSQTSERPETPRSSFHAPHVLLRSFPSFYSACFRASVLQFLDRWKHFSGAAGARGSISLLGWRHRLDHCRGNHTPWSKRKILICAEMLTSSWTQTRLGLSLLSRPPSGATFRGFRELNHRFRS